MPQRGDKQVLGLARGGGLNLLGQLCSQLAMLLITLLLARRLGRDDVGRYAQAFALLSLLALLSLSGLRTGLTRFVAVHLVAGRAGAVRGTVRLVAAAVAAWALRRLLRRVGPAAPTFSGLRELLGFSMLSWGASLASSGLVWADTLLIGVLRSSAEVGVYNVATRLVTLATFVMPAINGAFGPRIANLHHRGDSDSLRRTYAVATSWILRLSPRGCWRGHG